MKGKSIRSGSGPDCLITVEMCRKVCCLGLDYKASMLLNSTVYFEYVRSTLGGWLVDAFIC